MCISETENVYLAYLITEEENKFDGFCYNIVNCLSFINHQGYPQMIF